jgi:hypothetical protein
MESDLTPEECQERRQTLQWGFCAGFYGLPVLLLVIALGPFSPAKWADLQARWNTQSNVARIRRQSDAELAISKAELDAGLAQLQLRAAQRLRALDCIPVKILRDGEPIADLSLQPTMQEIGVPLDALGQPLYPRGTCVKSPNGATGISDGRHITDILPPPPDLPSPDEAQGASQKKVALGTE